jgi:hypothetical protein
MPAPPPHRSASTRMWLDEEGRFLFGKHEGEMAEDVAHRDPDYLRWIVFDAEDVADEDRKVMEQLLVHRSRR